MLPVLCIFRIRRAPVPQATINRSPASSTCPGTPDPETGSARNIKIGFAEGALLARVTERSRVALDLAPGHEVFAIVKSVAIDRQNLAGLPAHGPGEDVTFDL